MAHMQLTGNVRRRNYNAERLFARFRLCMEISVLFPKFIPFLFNRSGVINFGDVVFFCHVYSSSHKFAKVIKNVLFITNRTTKSRYHLSSRPKPDTLKRLTHAYGQAYFQFSLPTPGLLQSHCFRHVAAVRALSAKACAFTTSVHSY